MDLRNISFIILVETNKTGGRTSEENGGGEVGMNGWEIGFDSGKVVGEGKR